LEEALGDSAYGLPDTYLGEEGTGWLDHWAITMGKIPQGEPQFYRIAEVHFPSMEALQQCAASAGGKETLAHAVKISSGGPPVMMIAEEDTFTF